MASVTINKTLVGSPEEVEKYGGGIPKELKAREKHMSQAEKDSFKGKITAGTTMDVDPKRAQELADLGYIDGKESLKEKEVKEKKNAPKEKATNLSSQPKAKSEDIPSKKKQSILVKKGGK